jgi:hypothetical protein
MVISRKLQGLLPEWAPFLRGVVELTDCSPTASREDLVRDRTFEQVRAKLDELLYEHFERLADDEPMRLQSLIAWHRYTLAGAALEHPRLRNLLRHTYRFATSRGPLSFDEILERSAADPLFEADADRVVWYNPDRRQEAWANSLFVGHAAPCVHTLRSFEESLLAALVDDAEKSGLAIAMRVASPGTDGFAATILGMRDLEEAPPAWQAFLGASGAKVFCGSYDASMPVMAFLNERRELLRTFDQLKQQGSIPPGFQRLIDAHFRDEIPAANEVVLNRNHPLVARALAESTAHPLASVLRLVVLGALSRAGMSVDRALHETQEDDLQWIAEALWTRRRSSDTV